MSEQASGARALRSVGDVAKLPSVTFGDRSLMWWGTLGFMTIEGWTMALLLGVYFYLRQHANAWPPERTALPSLYIPTANLVLMLLSIVPMFAAARAAKRASRVGVRLWLVVSSLLAILILALRWPELWALNTRWDTHAYGSIAWVLVGFHGSLLLLDVADTVVLTLFFLVRPMPVKSFSDVNDNSFYWYFTVGSWIPIYLIVYLAPHFFRKS